MSGMIYKQMALVQAAVGFVGKNKVNQHQKYQFRAVDDVMAALQAVMAEHGVICLPEVIEREREVGKTQSGGMQVSCRFLVRHTFYAEDGSSVVATTLGEASDTSDKASNKAMSAALKYALTESFMIPTYEAHRDTEDDSPPVVAPERQFASHAEQRRYEAQTQRAAHPVVKQAQDVFPGSIVVEPSQFERVVNLVRGVFPEEEGPDRDSRLLWWYSAVRKKKFASLEKAGVPEAWSPSKAFAQLSEERRSEVEAEAAALAAKQAPPDREPGQEG